MIKVRKLIEELRKYPPDALAYAYEGEFDGIVIVEKPRPHEHKELGLIQASEFTEED